MSFNEFMAQIAFSNLLVAFIAPLATILMLGSLFILMNTKENTKIHIISGIFLIISFSLEFLFCGDIIVNILTLPMMDTETYREDTSMIRGQFKVLGFIGFFIAFFVYIKNIKTFR